eukprot:COSAG05_NODE_21029_length_275_cov_0.585227_1_plen_58_part_00
MMLCAPVSFVGLDGAGWRSHMTEFEMSRHVVKIQKLFRGKMARRLYNNDIKTGADDM